METMKNIRTLSPSLFSTLFLLVGLALTACSSTPPTPIAPIAYTNATPIRLNAGSIEVVDQFKPPLAAPNVDHLFVQTPAAAVRAWAQGRLRAAGQSGAIRVTIVDASVKAVALPIRTG